MTMRELAKAHGISLSTLGKQAKEGKWAKKREQHRNKVVTNACARAGARQSRKLAKAIGAVDVLMDHLWQEVQDPMVIHRHVGSESDEKGHVTMVEKEFATVNTKALLNLTKALQNLTSSIRDLYGLDNRQDEREERRLDLEERKVVLAEQKEVREHEGPQEIVFRMEGIPDEYFPPDRSPPGREQTGNG